jgi:hypothetical protein
MKNDTNMSFSGQKVGLKKKFHEMKFEKSLTKIINEIKNLSIQIIDYDPEKFLRIP